MSFFINKNLVISFCCVYHRVNQKRIRRTSQRGKFLRFRLRNWKRSNRCSLIYPFKKCIGIAFLESLYKISEEHKTKYDDNIKKQFLEYSELFAGINKPVRFYFYKFFLCFIKVKWFIFPPIR